MKTIKCALVGQSQFSFNCLLELEETGHQVEIVVSDDEKIRNLCDDLVLGSTSKYESVRDYKVDYIFDYDRIFDVDSSSAYILRPFINCIVTEETSSLSWIAESQGRQFEIASHSVESSKLNDLKYVEEQMFRLFQEVTTALSRCESINDFPIFTMKSKENYLDVNLQLEMDKWNNSFASFPKDKTITDCFEDRLKAWENEIAVVSGDEKLTYGELNIRANNFAADIKNKLRKKLDRPLSPDDIVGVNIHRSVDVIVALLGVLKAGIAYLPIDPKTPNKRVQKMLVDVKAIGLVTDDSDLCEDCPSSFDDLTIFSVESTRVNTFLDNMPRSNNSTDLAYVMFTSGSTGDAKAVMIEHQNLVSSTYARFEAYKEKVKSYLMVSSLSFDSSVAGIYWTLLSGGQLVIPEEDSANNVTDLAELINKHTISHILCIPSLYSLILDEGKSKLSSLETVIVAGEVCHLSVVEKHFQTLESCDLVNEYGPTEATVWSSYSYLEPDKNTIGKPIANTKMYILDETLNPVNLGEVGELYIGGAGVSRGYLNLPEVNQSVFLDLDGIGRVYKTGDLVSWNKGELEYHGRSDSQVKINGHRIETGEVEAVLNRYEDLSDSAVIAYGDLGSKTLIAYCVPGMFSPDVAEIQNYLSDFLMDYMIPQHFVVLEDLPRLPNGKVNRKGLPIPDFRNESSQGGVAHSSMETKLAGLWCRVLGLEQVGTHDDFFDLGGHSLLAVRLVQLVSKELQLQFTMKDFLKNSTIFSLAKWLETQNQMQEYWPSIVTDEDNRYEPFDLTSVQSAYWIGRSNSLKLGRVATHVYSEQDFQSLDLDRLQKTLNILIKRHEMLRMIVLPSGKQKVLSEVPEYILQTQKVDVDSGKVLLDDWRNELSHQVLDVTQWPLFDIRVSRFKDRDRLHLSMDALLFDALSVRIFLDEWGSLYRNMSTPLSSINLSFRDYMTSFQKLKSSKTYEKDKKYWFDRIDQLPLGPELPLAIQPEHIRNPQFSRKSQLISKEKWARIKEKAQHFKVTPTSVLLAAYASVLSKWSKQPHFLMNLTIFNRFPLHEEVDKILGDFTSLQLLEIGAEGTPNSFNKLVQQVHGQLWQDMEHRLMDGIEIQREMIKRRGSEIIGRVAPVVFTSILNQPSENSHPFELPIDEHIEEVYAISQTPQLWLDNKAYEYEGGLVAEWDYVQDLFPQEMITDMHDSYCLLINSLADLDWNKDLIELVPKKQIQIIETTNQTHQDLETNLIHQPIFDFADINPNKLAVVDEKGETTFGKLVTLSKKIASELQESGSQNKELIAVLMKKSSDQVAACLGTLHAGAAYLPLNSSWPISRIIDVLKQGDVKRIVTHGDCFKKIIDSPIIHDYQVLNIDEFTDLRPNRVISYTAELSDTAYVIFTSGSTGKPKGVSISHESASNTIQAMDDRFSISEDDAVLGLSKLSFDLSVWDIFGVLGKGGVLVLPDEDLQKDPTHWLDLIEDYGVTLWNTVPMLMQMLVEHLKSLPKRPSCLGELRLVLMSGDVIPLDLPKTIESYWPNSELISLGGATEGSIWSIWYDLKEMKSHYQSVPYGLAMPNQKMYILDGNLYPKPDLVTGGIYIGGKGVAQCYYNDPVKTEASFTIHPETGERLYRTGDLGYRRTDGLLMIVGREDSQVKVGGHRIELGEVEQAITAHPDVSESVVITTGDKRKKLHAFITRQSRSNSLFRQEDRSESAISWEKLNMAAAASAKHIHYSDELINRLEYTQEMERASSMIMMSTLQDLGAFCEVGDSQECANLASNLSIVPTYHKLFNQWIEKLIDSKYLVSDGVKITCIKVPKENECSEFMMSMRCKYNRTLPELLGYFESSQSNLMRLLLGQEDALNLFMPNGSTSVMEYMYRRSDLAKYYNSIVESSILDIVKQQKGRKIRVLELGAGIGGTTKGILPLFDPDNTDYHYTDLSTFFFNRAKEEYAEYPFVDYRLLDISKPFQYQGFKSQSYDIVLASNVIHNAPHLKEALRNIHQVLVPGGILFLMEGTENCSLQMLNIGFIEGLSEYDDERKESNLPLLSIEAWKAKLDEAGYEKFSSFGDELGAGGLAKENVILAKKSSSEEIFESEKFKSYLSQKLPSYMVPDDYFVLEKLPLSSNGKVDRNVLSQCGGHGNESSLIVKTPPRTDFERVLAEVWVNTLSCNVVGIEDNFFELGGDSIHAIQVVSALRNKGYQLDLAAVFSEPTLLKLALNITYINEVEEVIVEDDIQDDDMQEIMKMMEGAHA